MDVMSLEAMFSKSINLGLRYWVVFLIITSIFIPVMTFSMPDQARASRQENERPNAVIDSPNNADKFDMGEIVHFDASSSTDPDNDTLTYKWNFGDGTTGAGVKTTHVYEFPWVPIVKLEVDDGELNDTARVVIIIGTGGGQNRPPTARINTPQNGDTFMVGEEIIFDGSNSSDPDEDDLTYLWDFGDDNSSSSAITTHEYADTGAYLVTLTVSDGIFNDSERVTIFVNNTPPVADAGEDQVGFVNEELFFDGSNSSDPDRLGRIVNYTWDMGDFSTQYGVSISHKFDQFGSFIVILTVTDNDGATGSDALEVIITNSPPIAVLSVTTQDTVVGVDIEFDASASYDMDGNVEEYNFNFGDGTKSDWISQDIVTHRYFDIDKYQVTLTVRDNMGELSEPVTIEVDISEKVNQPPTVSIGSPLPNEQVAGLVIVKGSAQDPDSNVETMTVKIDNGDWEEARIIESRANTIGWEYDWDTEKVDDGDHTITARAGDGKKFSEEKSIRVKVNNRPTTFIEITEHLKPTVCLPKEDVEVSGTAMYDTNVPVKNTNVKIEIEETAKSWTAKTNEQGKYSYEFKAPAEPGKYTITVFITDGTLQHSNSEQLTVQTLPDLYIQPNDISFSFSNKNPVPKERVKIVVTIHNAGETAAKGTVSFYQDSVGNSFQSLSVNVPEKGSVLVQSYWVAQPGKHTIIVIISEVNPEDSDPSNNRVSKEISVEEVSEETEEKGGIAWLDELNKLSPLYKYSILGVIVVIILLIVISLVVRAARRRKTTQPPDKRSARVEKGQVKEVVFKPIDDKDEKRKTGNQNGGAEKTIVKFETIGIR